MEKTVDRSALISDEYVDLNLKLHLKWPSYGSSGGKWAQAISELGIPDILDYGCGKGYLKQSLGWKTIREYDPAMPGKNRPPEPADLIVCTDVLEHIEPDMLEMVFAHMRSLMRKKGFFVVSTVPAHKELPDGRNAHLIVQPIEWWRERLQRYFTIEHIGKSEDEFVVIVS